MPRVTFALLFYNQEEFVDESVAAALRQDYEPIEIIFSDDCSSDGTYEGLTRAISGYVGPHKVRLRRNPSNLGLFRHMLAVVQEAQGDIIVPAAGDDISLPHRTRTLVDRLLSDPSSGIAYSQYLPELRDGSAVRDPQGLKDISRWALEDILDKLPFLGPSYAIRRELMTRFPIVMSRPLNEDQLLPLRAAALGMTCLYVDLPLVRYRFDTGVSGRWRAGTVLERARGEKAMVERRLLVLQQFAADLAAIGHDSACLSVPLSRARGAQLAARYGYAGAMLSLFAPGFAFRDAMRLALEQNNPRMLQAFRRLSRRAIAG